MIEFLAWDSEFFGFKIGRLNLQDANYDEAEAKEEGFKCVYLYASQPLKTLPKSATLMDERVEYSWIRRPDNTENAPHIVQAKAEDLTQLLPLVPGAFTDSRFYRDSRFDRARVQQFFERWLENSFCGFADYVLTDSQRQSFVTVKNDRIGIIAVGTEARGRGLGKALLAEVQNRSQGHIWVATQSQNLSARRLYEACDFHISETAYIYHSWPNLG